MHDCIAVTIIRFNHVSDLRSAASMPLLMRSPPIERHHAKCGCGTDQQQWSDDATPFAARLPGPSRPCPPLLFCRAADRPDASCPAYLNCAASSRRCCHRRSIRRTTRNSRRAVSKCACRGHRRRAALGFIPVESSKHIRHARVLKERPLLVAERQEIPSLSHRQRHEFCYRELRKTSR